MTTTTITEETKTTIPNGHAAPVVLTRAADEPERAISAFASEVNFGAAQRMAKALAASSLVPAAYRGVDGIANCLIAMELASRIGASPLMVMQNLHVVQGRPSWSASFLIATVNASKRFSPLRFEWRGEGKDRACRCVAKDRASGEVCAGTWISWRLVEGEGWSKKSGSKWLTMPEQMYCYRAAAFWARIYAPELSLGIHTTEEIQDFTGALGGVATSDAQLAANSSPAALEAELLETVAKAATSPQREPGEEG